MTCITKLTTKRPHVFVFLRSRKEVAKCRFAGWSRQLRNRRARAFVGGGRAFDAPDAMRAASPARAAGPRFPSPARRCARRGPAPARGAFHGSGAPGSGQRIVELATKGDVAGLRDLLDSSYGGGVGASSELDASTRAIVGAQVRTAAQRAAHAGQDTTLRLLLERGADLGLGYGNGRCVAVEAAARGHASVLEVLLTVGGASTETQNGYGRTCLLEAAKEGHVECVRVALAAGADIDFVTKNANMSAAMFAAAENRAECLNVLRDAGCDLDIERTLDGKTAMQIHRETVQTEMRKVLGKA